jgi:hypothetical protein
MDYHAGVPIMPHPIPGLITLIYYQAEACVDWVEFEIDHILRISQEILNHPAYNS